MITFQTKEEAELWKAIVKIRATENASSANDIDHADRVVTNFRLRKAKP